LETIKWTKRVASIGGVIDMRASIQDMDSDPCDSAVESDEPAPVFLVGFPRSGTTLLDKIMDDLPGIQVLEERPR